LSKHAEHSQAAEGISPSGMVQVKIEGKSKYSGRTWGQGYLRERDWDENHKENCNYKEEGHIARLIVSVAGHGTREILEAGVLVYRLPPSQSLAV
jgi:hypothetical protein